MFSIRTVQPKGCLTNVLFLTCPYHLIYFCLPLVCIQKRDLIGLQFNPQINTTKKRGNGFLRKDRHYSFLVRDLKVWLRLVTLPALTRNLPQFSQFLVCMHYPHETYLSDKKLFFLLMFAQRLVGKRALEVVQLVEYHDNHIYSRVGSFFVMFLVSIVILFYLWTFPPANTIVRPSQFVFFQVIIVSSIISLSGNCTNTVRSAKIYLQLLNPHEVSD